MPTIDVLGNKLTVKKAPKQSDKGYILSRLPPIATMKKPGLKGSPAQQAQQAALMMAAKLVRWSTWDATDIITYTNIATKKEKDIQRPAAVIGLVISSAYVKVILGKEDTAKLLKDTAIKMHKNLKYKKNKKTEEDVKATIKDIADNVYTKKKDKFSTPEDKEGTIQKNFDAADALLKEWMGEPAPADTLSSRRSYSDFSDFF